MVNIFVCFIPEQFIFVKTFKLFICVVPEIQYLFMQSLYYMLLQTIIQYMSVQECFLFDHQKQSGNQSTLNINDTSIFGCYADVIFGKAKENLFNEIILYHYIIM